MDICFQLTRRDAELGHEHAQARMRAQGERLGFWSALGLGMLGGLLWQMYVRPDASWVWVVFLAVFLALAGWEVYSVRFGHYLRWLARREGDYALDLADAGISLRMPDATVFNCAWAELSALEAAEEFLIFYLRTGAAFAVPRAALGENASQALLARARRLWAAAPENRGQALPTAPAAPESPSYQAWINLREAVRLVLFAPVHPRAFRVSLGALVIHLAALAFMLGAICYLQALPIPLLNAAGIGVFVAPLVLVFVWVAVVGMVMSQNQDLLRMLSAAVAVLLAVSMVAFLAHQVWLRQIAAEPILLHVWQAIAVLWLVVALARLVRALFDSTRLGALGLAGVYVLLALVLPAMAPQGSLYLSASSIGPFYVPRQRAPKSARPHAVPHAPPSVKDDSYPDDDEGDATQGPEDSIDVEDTYYRQPQLVSKSLAGIRPHRAGETGLYFVGFAGDGSAHEFFNEVRYARKLMDRRFDTAGRSITLANSYETVQTLPLANTHNMAAVLQGLAQRMDKQHDVLFLFLSSHGAQNHWLEVNLEPLDMDDLKAENLKAMLDNSGIRNRVIVVSTCYSGDFVDVLKDDNTLILTASRSGHAAYGCGDSTEYTYFGKAYFVNALTGGDSFIDAFDEARARIAAREKAGNLDPSDPQISVGRNIAAVLKQLKVAPAAPADPKAAGTSPAH